MWGKTDEMRCMQKSLYRVWAMQSKQDSSKVDNSYEKREWDQMEENGLKIGEQ